MATLVLYHIPSDLDDFNCPNAFIIPKQLQDISLNDLHEYFPLPGEYRFRVKNGDFWLDLREGQSTPLAPMGAKRIILKVVRVNWKKQERPVEPMAPAATLSTVDDFDAFFG